MRRTLIRSSTQDVPTLTAPKRCGWKKLPAYLCTRCHQYAHPTFSNHTILGLAPLPMYIANDHLFVTFNHSFFHTVFEFVPASIDCDCIASQEMNCMHCVLYSVFISSQCLRSSSFLLLLLLDPYTLLL
jgi:hypothetical protein